MPFSSEKNINSKRKKISENPIPLIMALESDSSRINSDLIPQTSANYFFLSRKRAASFAFPCNAFVSIEASLCLTIFLMACLSVLSFGTVMNQKMRLEVPLKNTCSKIAQDYVIYDAIKGDKISENLVDEYGVLGVGIIAARQIFISEAGQENLDKSIIVGGSNGISFLYSDILDDEGYVDLIINYKIELPFKLIPFPDIKMVQRSRIYPWVGSNVYTSEIADEKYVFVTKSGTVYHVSLSCRHLNIKINKTSVDLVWSLRNEAGGKYYPCEICYKNSSGSIVYVTGTGTSYHAEGTCPTLTRDIQRISLSDALGMPACKSCGG